MLLRKSKQPECELTAHQSCWNGACQSYNPEELNFANNWHTWKKPQASDEITAQVNTLQPGESLSRGYS